MVPLLSNTASAAAGNPGDDLSSVPPLISGVTYGSTTVADESTTANGKTSGHAACGTTEGASVHRVSDTASPAGARLDLTVRDDAGGQSLCAIDVFRRTGSSATLTGIYDNPSRDDFQVATSECPLAASTCSLAVTLSDADTYYVVFWPAGDNTPPTASFGYDASLREATTTGMGVSGGFETRGSCLRVRAGRSFSATATVAPDTATGVATFDLLKKDAGGVYRRVGLYPRSLVSARAVRSFELSFGQYKVRATYGGDGTRAPSTSVLRCVAVVTATRVTQALAGNSRMIDDYYVYRSGRTITVTTTLAQVPAGGVVRFRLDREVGEGTYRTMAAYARAVSGGKAVFRFSMPYRSGLPFYRIRSEYQGDMTHFPGTSAWNCIWITR